MSIFDRWRERRNNAWWARWHREHRWDRLGTYNAESGRGIVHTAEYEAAMAVEQSLFDEEQRREWEAAGAILLGDDR